VKGKPKCVASEQSVTWRSPKGREVYGDRTAIVPGMWCQNLHKITQYVMM